LKTQIKCLLSDNEEVKLGQEELSSAVESVNRQVALLSEALERLAGGGRTDVFR